MLKARSALPTTAAIFSILCGLLLLEGHAEATCWTKGDGKSYCCSPPGGPVSCRQFTQEQLRQQHEAKEKRKREAAKRAEERRLRRLEEEQRQKRWHEQRRRREQLNRYRLQQRKKRLEALRRWRERDPEGYRRAMERRQRLAHEREERARRARLTRRLRARGEGAWQRGLGFQLGVGPALRLAEGDAPGSGAQAGLGLDASASLLYRRRYDDSSMLSPRGSLALAAVPITNLLVFFLLPKSAFVGNDLGATVQAQLTWPTASDDRFRTLLLFAPRLRVSPTRYQTGSRWSFNSMLGVLIPKVGLEIDSDGTRSWALEWFNLSYAFALSRHLGLELDAAVSLREGHGERGTVAGGNVRLRLIVFD